MWLFNKHLQDVFLWSLFWHPSSFPHSLQNHQRWLQPRWTPSVCGAGVGYRLPVWLPRRLHWKLKMETQPRLVLYESCVKTSPGSLTLTWLLLRQGECVWSLLLGPGCLFRSVARFSRHAPGESGHLILYVDAISEWGPCRRSIWAPSFMSFRASSVVEENFLF